MDPKQKRSRRLASGEPLPAIVPKEQVLPASNEMWMEHLVCAVDVVDYACVSDFPSSPRPTRRMECTSEVDPREEVGCRASQCSPESIATERVEAPSSRTINAGVRGFSSLLNFLSESDRASVQSVRCLHEDDQWSDAFASMSPKEYASLVMAMDSEVDRPEVAALIAPYVNNGRFAREDAITVLDSAEIDAQASFPGVDINVLATHKQVNVNIVPSNYITY